ncbi:serine hydrolase domain-containing protein [Carboxylicivirga sp. N1Y90]|uniref:serine hydrolase domain-containing protein n=1 Tax=Carboxylicivirga fragile TaxID=3417571 RepID=UPI003D339BF9
MRLLLKTSVSVIMGTVIWASFAFFYPMTESFGSDFTPPKNTPNSFKVANFFSENDEFAYLEKQVNRFIRREHLAGASVAIAKDGELLYAKGFGYADKENMHLVEPHHLFRVASVSKLVTAVGVMKMIEDGQLTLDSKVFGQSGILNDSIYLNYIDKRVTDITVRHLLEHSGGWTTRWGDQMFMPTIIARSLKKSLPVDESDIIRFVLSKRLHFTPGQSSYYSNLGYMVLGQVISKVSGLDYEKYIQTNVLYPLGIFDMQLGGSHLNERVESEVKYYEPEQTFYVDDYTGTGEQVLRTYGGNDMHTLGAAGGWIASSTDLMKLLLSIDGFESYPDVLDEESIETMSTPIRLGYSPLGWRRIKKDAWYRTGTLAGTSALMVRKNDGISYVVLVNTGSWKGPALANDISKVMERGLRKVTDWPEYNLFELDNSWASNRKRPQVIY